MKNQFLVRSFLLLVALGLGAYLVPLARVEAATNVPCDTAALVNAVQDAVNAGGSQTLKLAKDCNYVLTQSVFDGGNPANATGLPKINKVNLTIKGNGATIKRKANAPRFRLFFVAKKGDLTLQNLTLRGGHTASSGNSTPTGAGGAIYLEFGKLTLKQVTVTGNQTGRGVDTSVTGGTAGYGGGIANYKGELTVVNSQITNNAAGDGGNSSAQLGGAAGAGGGIFSYYGMLTVDASTIDGNRAGKGGNGPSGAGGGGGGGIYASHLRITNSTVSNNQAGKGGDGTSKCGAPGGSGGGIFAVIAVIANTTISGNQAGDGGTENNTTGWACGSDPFPSASGGGVFGAVTLVNNVAAGDVYITNSTIAGNRAGHRIVKTGSQYDDGRGENLYAYGGYDYGYEVYLRNTLLGASGFGDSCAAPLAPYSNVIVNVANNLDAGTSCGFGSANGSKSNANANLGPLQDNGGDTFTHALLPGSAALDSGNDAVCTAAVGSPNYGAGGKDQREIARPQFAHCDIGAYEHQAPPTATPTPTSTPTVTPSPTPTQVPPGGDGALDFDGTDDFVEIGTSANLLLNADLTLEIWAKPDSFSNNPTLITRAVEGDGDAANNYSYYFYITPAKNLALFWEWGTGFTEITLTSSVAASINAGEWHHLAVTRSATNSTVRFFVDGVELGTAQSFGTLPTGGSNGRTVIGANPRPTDTTLHFDGQLDEARIWNIVRTPGEIQANVYQQPNIASSGLVAYYKFDEPNGQTINDATTPAEHGTLGKTNSAATDDPTRVTSTMPTQPTGTCAGPSNGRISCWKADGNANDSVGSNHGTLVGNATYAAGKFGQAFSFDGDGDYVDLGDPNSLDFSSGLTVSAWIKPTNTNSQMSVITKWAYGCGDMYGMWVGGSYDIGGAIGTNCGDGGFSANGVITWGQWQHVAMTYDAATGTNKLYVNGVEVASRGWGGNISASTAKFYIGAEHGGPPRYFKGLIDDAQAWNRGLSAQEIMDVYNASTGGGTCDGPSNGRVSCWKGENNANDSVGTNNGTLEGSVTFVEGKVGQAFNFDGTTANVRVPASSSLNVGSANGLTIAAWVNPTTLAQRSPLVEWSNNGTYGAHFLMSVTDVIPGGVNGNLYANLKSFAGGTQYVVQTTGAVLTANSWQHVVLTYNKTNGNVAIYVNGVASPVSSSNLGIVTPDTSFDMYLARRPAGQAPAARFSGKMDEVQIWNRVLSAQEIKDVYNGSGGSSCTDKPEKPTLKVPADGSIINTTQPKLKWNQAECATTYNVTIQDPLGQTVAKETGLTKLQYSPLLTAGYTYKWFVQAVNEHGKTKSAAWTFFIE